MDLPELRPQQPSELTESVSHLRFTSHSHVGEPSKNPARFTVQLPSFLQTDLTVEAGKLCHSIDVHQINIAGLQNVKESRLFIHFQYPREPGEDIASSPGNFRVEVALPGGLYDFDGLLKALNHLGSRYFRLAMFEDVSQPNMRRVFLSTLLPKDILHRYPNTCLEVPQDLAIKLGILLPQSRTSSTRPVLIAIPLVPRFRRSLAVNVYRQPGILYPFLQIQAMNGPLPVAGVLIQTILNNQFSLFGPRGWFQAYSDNIRLTVFATLSCKSQPPQLDKTNEIKQEVKTAVAAAAATAATAATTTTATTARPNAPPPPPQPMQSTSMSPALPADNAAAMSANCYTNEETLELSGLQPVSPGPNVTFFSKYSPDVWSTLRIVQLHLETAGKLLAHPLTKYSPFGNDEFSCILASAVLDTSKASANHSIVSLAPTSMSKTIWVGQSETVTFILKDYAGQDISVQTLGEVEIVAVLKSKML